MILIARLKILKIDIQSVVLIQSALRRLKKLKGDLMNVNSKVKIAIESKRNSIKNLPKNVRIMGVLLKVKGQEVMVKLLRQ